MKILNKKKLVNKRIKNDIHNQYKLAIHVDNRLKEEGNLKYLVQ